MQLKCKKIVKQNKKNIFIQIGNHLKAKKTSANFDPKKKERKKARKKTFVIRHVYTNVHIWFILNTSFDPGLNLRVGSKIDSQAPLPFFLNQRWWRLFLYFSP